MDGKSYLQELESLKVSINLEAQKREKYLKELFPRVKSIIPCDRCYPNRTTFDYDLTGSLCNGTFTAHSGLDVCVETKMEW